MGEFLMPSLGADMDEGTLLEWLVAPGDAVRKGDIVAVVDTEKSDIEVEVFESGVVEELLVDVGTTVPVGTPLARIGAADATTRPAAAAPAEAPPAEAPPAAAAPTPVPATPVTGPPRGLPTTERTAGRVLSPVVRHLADELHVDIGHLRGTGPGGVVTRHDVEVAVARAPHPRPRDEHWVRSSPLARRLASERGVTLAELTGTGPDGAVVAADVPDTSPAPAPAAGSDPMRAAIARAMTRAKREIPHYYLHTTIDLGQAMTWLRAHNEDRPITERILPAVLLLKATAMAAAEHPELNGWWEEGHRPSTDVTLGVAIALRRGGLVAPGIADADRRDLTDLMAALRDLTARARAGRLRQREWTGPTITVTSLGDLGVDAVAGVIHPPQLAMVGFGAVHDAVVAVDGEAVVRPVVVASLAADHRASDGIQGAAFLGRITDLLQQPDTLATATNGATP